MHYLYFVYYNFIIEETLWQSELKFDKTTCLQVGLLLLMVHPHSRICKVSHFKIIFKMIERYTCIKP